MKKGAPTNEVAAAITRETRAMTVMELATEGWTYKAIADALGVSPGTAREDLLGTLDLVTEERRKLGKQFVDVQLGILYRALSVALEDFARGTWQQGRTVVALTDQINKLLDLYPRDGQAGAGMAQTINMSFSTTTTRNTTAVGVIQNSLQTAHDGQGEAAVNPMDRINQLIEQARLVAAEADLISPEPEFGSDEDTGANEAPLVVRRPDPDPVKNQIDPEKPRQSQVLE